MDTERRQVFGRALYEHHTHRVERPLRRDADMDATRYRARERAIRHQLRDGPRHAIYRFNSGRHQRTTDARNESSMKYVVRGVCTLCTRMTVPLERVTRSFVSTFVPLGTHTSHCCSMPTMPLCPCSFISPSFGSLTRHLTPVAMVVKPSDVVPHALVVGVMREMVNVMSIAESMVPWHLAISIGDSTVHIPSHQLGRAHPHLSGEVICQHLQPFALLRHGEGRAAHGAEAQAGRRRADPAQHYCSCRAVHVVGFAHDVDRRGPLGKRPIG